MKKSQWPRANEQAFDHDESKYDNNDGYNHRETPRTEAASDYEQQIKAVINNTLKQDTRSK